jgi:hypothetical protein
MNCPVLLGLAAIAGMAIGAENPDGALKAPPVLRRLEPDDSVVLRLPGPTAARPVIKNIVPIAPVPRPSPLPSQLVVSALPPLPDVPSVPKQDSSVSKPALPPEAQDDLAFYCQKHIGKWKRADVRALLGPALRNRPAYDESKAINGRIYAFRDPTGRYRELELDFDSKTGALRTVFVYPPRLTWKEVHHRWNGEVSVADAQQGRTFYSYVHRRMDVLVDSQGKVISLGLY